MSVVVIGLSHRTSPVEVREKFAFAEPEIPLAVSELRQRGLAEEAVILSTCNRVELYIATPLEPERAFTELHDFLVTHHAYPDPVHDHLYKFAEPDSLHHLFKVASGLDSMVLGETEILGQLKQAYDLALKHKCTGGRLNKAFQRAFNVAKHIRTNTNIQRGSISVASVSVELAEKIFDSLKERQVMVIGAGDTSEKTARALLSRGAKGIVVTNRTVEKAEAIAKELGGRAIGFDDWETEFAHIDIAISSTSAPHYVITPQKLGPLMKLRRNRPLLLIDIAVPRDIDPDVNQMDNVYLYNVDDLQLIANDYLQQRREEVAQCEAIIREKVQGLLGAQRPPTTA
jgi:glutamyl-tRNA reductase